VCDEQSVNCVMNKLSFEMSSCDLCIYMFVYISVRSVYIYLYDLCKSVLCGLCYGLQTDLVYRCIRNIFLTTDASVA
jgi:hypothetical protein